MARTSPPPPDTLPEEEYDRPMRKPKPQPAGILPPLWSVALTFFLALGMAACLIGSLIALGGRSSIQADSKPVILVTSAPSPTSALEEFLNPTATLDLPGTPLPAPSQSIQLSGPTLVPTTTATATPIAVGVGVQVIIISQGGIRVRSTPGMSSAVNFVADYSEIFRVIGGPDVIDGLRWWQIQDEANPARSGWAAENDGIADLFQVYVP
jgi:hypothetical protein